MDTVVVGTTQKEDDSDRFDVLDRVLEDAGFWNTLEERFLSSGKTKKDFLVAVKPNLMMWNTLSQRSQARDIQILPWLNHKMSSGTGSKTGKLKMWHSMPVTGRPITVSWILPWT
jgi:hypothetical protein